MNRKFVVFIVMLLTLVVATQVYAAIVGIDNFNVADQDVCVPTTVCPSGVSSSAVAYASAIGGERDMVVTRSGGSQSVTAYAGVDVGGGADVVGYSQGTGATGTWEIVWDGADGDPNNIDFVGLGGVDLSDAGTNTSLHIVGLTNDQPFTLRIEVYTDAANWSFANRLQPTQTSATVSIPIVGSFTTGGGGGADFTNVGAIRIFVDGSAIPALDVSFDYISADGDNPTAVTLQDVSASGQSAWFPFALGTVLMVLFSTTVIVNRKRKSVQ